MRVASAKTQAISAERAAGFVRSGMWPDYGTSLCQPDVFENALGGRIQELTDVKIRHCLTCAAAFSRASIHGRLPCSPR